MRLLPRRNRHGSGYWGRQMDTTKTSLKFFVGITVHLGRAVFLGSLKKIPGLKQTESLTA
jgi:hypothetical protein